MGKRQPREGRKSRGQNSNTLQRPHLKPFAKRLKPLHVVCAVCCKDPCERLEACGGAS